MYSIAFRGNAGKTKDVIFFNTLLALPLWATKLLFLLPTKRKKRAAQNFKTTMEIGRDLLAEKEGALKEGAGGKDLMSLFSKFRRSCL